MDGCEGAIRLLNLERDGEPVEPGERAELAAHLAACAACRGAERELAALGPLVRAAVPRPLPPAVVARFAARLAAERARERFWLEAGGFARGLVRVAAALALVTGIGAAQVVRSWPSADDAGSGDAVAVEATGGEGLGELGFADALVFGAVPLDADTMAEVAFGGRGASAAERRAGEGRRP